ncbi:MAG: type III-A CRISPR-associated protein Csm2 [Promethearchaeia archaeon]
MLKPNEILAKIRKLNTLKDIDDKEIYNENGLIANIASLLKNETKASQIRKFFDAYKNIEKKIETNYRNEFDKIRIDLLKTKPSLAYAVGRNLIPKWFAEIIFQLINKITNEKETFEKFIDIFESLIAYFKYYGGKD